MHTLIENDFLCYARAGENGWTAHCVDLDLAADGRTLAEAQTRLQTAIADYLDSHDADAIDDSEDEKPVIWTVSHPMC